MRGSIKKRVGKRGISWSGVVDLGRDPLTGARKQKRFSAPTRQEVQDWVTKTSHEVRTGTYLEPSDEPFAVYVKRWHQSLTVRGSTLRRYESIIDSNLIPVLGAKPLGKLTPADIQQCLTKALETMNSSSARNVYMVLQQCLEQAVHWQLLLRNPCAGIRPPRVVRHEMKVWTAEQVRAFLAATQDHPLHALWRLALGTGMRCGELVALRWSDLDLDGRYVSVTRTWTRNYRQWAIGDVKTTAGRRRISLPANCVQALRALFVEVGPDDEEDLIWNLSPRAVNGRFKRALRDTGSPVIRFHDLRHTSATLMLLNGEHPKVVSQRLGHSSVAITMDRYSHVLRGMEEAAAERLDALMGGDENVTTAPRGGRYLA